MKEFFEMGGYALYVWTSYGIAAVVLVYNVIAASRRHQAELSRIARKLKREQVKV